MFNKILIANRGEIAVRIIATAKKMGIRTVAIYSTADYDALFVKLADESYCIGSASLHDSYLNIAKIIAIAKQTNTNAIHPGYGFLSENADFATECMRANIKFIGPNADVIRDMGSKALAKSIMKKASIPLIPGYHEAPQEDKILLQEASKIGFPLLIKASAGGGGKGMRVVLNIDTFIDSLQACKREAKSSFGDDRVILEKYISNPRHIEVQVFGDNFGNVVHLYERDCSIQRRHQKVIEEAPASIREDAAAKLHLTAINAAKAINYTNAGTLEFLMDENEDFYFMEMNTRLQVEHPVTEMITGIDIVEWQIKVAFGEKLPLTQQEINVHGHAIEARIYAEDPTNNFLPTTGKVYLALTPHQNSSVRLDTGLKNNDVIGINYDPMLAKLIVKANTRYDAILKLNHALQATHFIGLKTNIAFLRNICQEINFVMGNTNTNYLNTINNNQYLPTEIAFSLTAAAYFVNSNTHGPNNSNWRLNSESSNSITLLYKGELFECEIIKKNNSMVQIINKNKNQDITTAATTTAKTNKDAAVATNKTPDSTTNPTIANIHHSTPNTLSITMDNKSYNVLIYQFDNLLYSSINSFDFNFNIPTTQFYATSNYQEQGKLTAPMPGRVTKILVKSGDSVRADAPLLIIEAMKMEHTITAPKAGKIKNLHYQLGETVEEGAVLLDLE